MASVNNPLRKKVKWKNGSKIEIIVGNVSSVKSHYPYKVHTDEIELMDREIWQESKNIEKQEHLSDINDSNLLRNKK